MSDAPDHLWINDKWEAYQRRTHDGDNTGYRRADLPPTLSAALELPEVRAIKDALSKCLTALTDFSCAYPHMVKGYMMDAEVTALAAIAAIKEPKP